MKRAIPADRHATLPKHRARAVQAMANHLCTTDYTDGFCGPRDGRCTKEGPRRRDCIRAATGLFEALVTVGIQVVWPYDKAAPGGGTDG
jgi:hypothetical protein